MIIMIAETNPPAFRLLASHWGRIVFKSRNAHRRCIRGYPQMCLYMLSFGNMMKNQLILGFQTSRDKPAWVWIRGFPMGFPMMFSYSSQLLCRWKASASQLFGCDLQSAKLRVHQGLRLKARLNCGEGWCSLPYNGRRSAISIKKPDQCSEDSIHVNLSICVKPKQRAWNILYDMTFTGYLHSISSLRLMAGSVYTVSFVSRNACWVYSCLFLTSQDATLPRPFLPNLYKTIMTLGPFQDIPDWTICFWRYSSEAPWSTWLSKPQAV